MVMTAFAVPLPLAAQREPVLKQIDLPHSYYYREMYLPQLTSGPSAVTWSPDSREVIYSMQGSLWRQRLDSTIAQQLTAGPGYDYQPDWSPDGRWVVYAKYLNDALELYALDLQSGKNMALTSGGAVNLEPRWSPDGRRIAFVSTAYNRRFHIFAGSFAEGKLNPVRLTGETRSALPRYYYSAYDHEISPTWSPDGTEIIFVSNRGHIYGTGGFWRMRAEPGAEAREIYFEETTWRARPDWSRDGKRLLYSSYLGRQWHQLWVTTPEGGHPFPLSYGEFDNTAARWSPDGKRIAFISNRSGNTSLWIQDAVSGEQRPLEVKQRRYLRRMASLRIVVLAPDGQPTDARVSVTGEDGRAYAPDDAWIHADEAFVRGERPSEPVYFHTRGEAKISVPAGKLHADVMKGFEYHLERSEVQLQPGEQRTLTVRLRPLPSLPGGRRVSSDLHVHMNYAGTYRNTPAHMLAQARAENLGIVNELVVNKEQRIPDITYFRPGADPASTPAHLLVYGQEFHTSYWGHLALLNPKRNLIIPDYAAYPGTGAASLFPMNSTVADMAHAQGALVGYVHPFEIEDLPDPRLDRKLTHELPVDAALGKVDYIEVLGFSDHNSTASVWYRLLNLGFRIPAGAGTDAMSNYASLHGPVGTNRVYVRVPDGPLRLASWMEGLRAGRTFATNGPLLDFTLGGQPIGSEVKLKAASDAVPFTASLRSIVPVDRLEVVCNGEVVKRLALPPARDFAETRGTVPLRNSGWCLLRAVADRPAYPVLDIYPYATTSPVYVTVAGEHPHSPADAAYFLAWIDRIEESVHQHKEWNTEAERRAVEDTLSRARTVYQQLR